MANLTIYKAESYNSNYYTIFSGIYNDFKMNAQNDYNFELQPLSYDNFIKSIENGLLNCIILLEDNIPTGFLAYTTLISESLELNIIHCIGNENLNAKRKVLLDKFIEINKHLMRERVVTYPMLGKQVSFAQDIQNFGFKIVNTAVMGIKADEIQMRDFSNINLPEDYSFTNWNNKYFKDASEVICKSFKDSSDALFDTRFASINGCKDILEKIIQNVYGTFLPEITKVILYKHNPIGFCFANLTNDKIANIPIAAIMKKHRNKGLSRVMINSLLQDLKNQLEAKNLLLTEINASCDADNMPAYKMYEAAGFTREYTYPQAYHPVI